MAYSEIKGLRSSLGWIVISVKADAAGSSFYAKGISLSILETNKLRKNNDKILEYGIQWKHSNKTWNFEIGTIVRCYEKEKYHVQA